ncbi:MAG: SIS domain-containing protein [Thermoleophilia bacterium]|nr:SIS domain-containing protein [Thermoleophilia bacterium]
MRKLEETAVWREARAIPEALERTVEAARGIDDVAALVAGRKRVVVTGNGASYYAALALWLASLDNETSPVDVVAIPAGLLAGGEFAWRSGDVLLAISSSGELRDVVEAIRASPPVPVAAITATADSTIARAATAVAVVHVERQTALTHTQAFCGNVLTALSVGARLCDDTLLDRAIRSAPSAVRRALALAGDWAGRVADQEPSPRAAIVLGSRHAWPAALEAALLLKEVARIPSEGHESREGATSGMYALARGQLAVSLPTADDPLLEEAEATCAGTGATVVRAPGGELADPRLAAITTFPAALALAVELGLRAGHDVDAPGWADAYYATARVTE